MSRTHAEIQSQKRRGFRLNIHTAANPPSLTQTVISRYKQAYLYVFDCLHKHMHPNTTHMLNIRNFCVLTDVCVSTHPSLLHLNGWGQCRPTNTHATVCGSANAEPISYIDMARALMRESERDRERERERKRDREDKGEKNQYHISTLSTNQAKAAGVCSLLHKLDSFIRLLQHTKHTHSISFHFRQA